MNQKDTAGSQLSNTKNQTKPLSFIYFCIEVLHRSVYNWGRRRILAKFLSFRLAALDRFQFRFIKAVSLLLFEVLSPLRES